MPSLSAHVTVTDEALADRGVGPILDELCECVSAHFEVRHATFQVEPLSHEAHEDLVRGALTVSSSQAASASAACFSLTRVASMAFCVLAAKVAESPSRSGSGYRERSQVSVTSVPPSAVGVSS